MSDISRNIARLNSSMRDSAGKLDGIMLVQESTAYCSAKTAEAVSLLADVTAYKHRNDLPLRAHRANSSVLDIEGKYRR